MKQSPMGILFNAHATLFDLARSGDLPIPVRQSAQAAVEQLAAAIYQLGAEYDRIERRHAGADALSQSSQPAARE